MASISNSCYPVTVYKLYYTREAERALTVQSYKKLVGDTRNNLHGLYEHRCNGV